MLQADTIQRIARPAATQRATKFYFGKLSLTMSRDEERPQTVLTVNRGFNKRARKTQ